MAPPQNQGLEASAGGEMLLARGGIVPAGDSFEDFMFHVNRLEQDAISQGIGFDARMSAFRRLWYSGMVWDQIITEARDNQIPQSWWADANGTSMNYLRQHKTINVGGVPVDMGHVFAGLDARRNRGGIQVGVASLDDNLGAATFIGDLASVAGEYYNMHGDSLGNTGHEDFLTNHRGAIDDVFEDFFKEEDMNSDLDAHSITLNPGLTIFQNLYNYYHVAQRGQGRTRRYTTFASRTGLVNQDGSANRQLANRLVQHLHQAIMMYQAGEIANGRGSFVQNLASYQGFGQREPHTQRPLNPQRDRAINNLAYAMVRMFLDKVIDGMSRE